MFESQIARLDAARKEMVDGIAEELRHEGGPRASRLEHLAFTYAAASREYNAACATETDATIAAGMAEWDRTHP